MKILLINPDPVPRVLPPLGLSYIAENLIAGGHAPILLDWGFEKDLHLEGVDLIGIGATTLVYHDACQIIGRIKAIDASVPVVIGGVHASVLPEFVMEDSGADAVVAGEGEEIMLQIADGSVEPHGILKAAVIEDLDRLPFPRYAFLDIRRYFKFRGADRIRWSLRQPSIAMIGTRGCPFACTFCGSKDLFGKKVRTRSVDNVMDEIDFLQDRYGVRSVYFYDDSFTLRRDWILTLCEALSKRRVEWICGTRVDMVDAALLMNMKRCGCKYISYGIESGSDRILLDVIKKGITITQVREALNLTRKAGIGIIANYMFGLPGETEEDMKATLDLVKHLPADAAELSIFMPFPGAELAEGLDWRGYASGKNPYHQPPILNDAEAASLAVEYHRKAVKAFYLSFRMVGRRLGLILRPRQMMNALRSLIRLMTDVKFSKVARSEVVHR